MIQPLLNGETELLGSWVNKTGSIITDDVGNRIEALISKELKEVGTSGDGWDVLYIDPSDGRYWELTYPDSDFHGGGAPRLSFMTAEQVKAKYGV